MSSIIDVRGLDKSFRLHNQGGLIIPVLRGLDLAVGAGECVVLAGPSGAGKSTLLRCLYGNYKPQGGAIRVRHDGRTVDVVTAHHQTILDMRRRTIGYVSQFLRVVPRVPALDIVAEPLRRIGTAPEMARARARELLERLAIPERMWSLAPQTFSGGEQQRVNIARGFAVDYPVLLLDEPTAALDADNRARVASLISDARRRGAAIVGIFHDQDFAAQVGTRRFDMTVLSKVAA
ncbi:MAG: phosphonate C-P lyase system protein PhnL [Alphaproteobacteria bacterium]|nr:phosphonate C-P lyase system protein PhnL [Alphaproteobacteria bacterium]